VKRTLAFWKPTSASMGGRLWLSSSSAAWIQSDLMPLGRLAAGMTMS
jgi:hypothetical protein